MKKTMLKKILSSTIIICILFVLTSCARSQHTDENKVLLTNNPTSEESNSKDNKINDEVLITEQRELEESRKVEMINKRKSISAAQIEVNKQKPPVKKVSGIPVLMYHSIAYEAKNELRVPEEKFDEQMKFLKDNDYTTLTMEEFYEHLNNGKLIPERSIIITFDDGYRDNYTTAYPILKKYNLKATIFLITELIDKDKNYINSSEAAELYSNGIDIESHTVHHEQLNLLSYDKQLRTLKNSKSYLENMLNKKITSVAYPYGKYNNDTLKASKDAGYQLAFTTKYGFAKKESGILSLNRVRINGSDSLNVFMNKIGASR